MKVSSCSESSPRNLPNSLPAMPDGAAVNDGLMANARVTYAPLAIWKDFHWTCTVTSFAPVRDRLE
ncbi:MAG: hypothetical protein ACTHJS_01260 [Xanthobacteraceae bacterium]